MLVRAAARHGSGRSIVLRSKQNTFRASALRACPSCLHTVPSVSISTDSSLNAVLQTRSTAALRRPFSTTIDRSSEAANVPLQDSPSPSSDADLLNLKPFTPENALQLKLPPEPVLPRYRVSVDSIGGDIREILSMLYACLQIGKLDRASLIVHRIVKLQVLSTAELVRIHRDLISAGVRKEIEAPKQADDFDPHSWFEGEVLRHGYYPDVEMVAWLLKSSLRQTSPMVQARLVRRYISLMSGDDALDVLSQEDVLTGEEVKSICYMVPAYKEFLETEGVDLDQLEAADAAYTADSSDATGRNPEIKATKQKGSGLRSLKEALSLFSRDLGTNISRLSPEALRERQLQLEEDAIASAINRWREENEERTRMGLGMSLQSKSVGDTMWQWHQALLEFLEEKLGQVDELEKKREMNRTQSEVQLLSISPYISQLPPDRVAAVAILTMMSHFTSSGITKGLHLSGALPKIGNAIEDECLLEQTRKNRAQQNRGKQNERKDIRRQLLRMKSAQRENRLQQLSGAQKFEVQGVEISEDAWPTFIKARVGAFLLRALIEKAKIPVTRIDPTTGEPMTQFQPAFMHAHQYRLGRKVGVVICNSTLADMLQREPVGSLLAKHLPMIVPPEPWTHFNKGGFFVHPVSMLRIKNGDKDQIDYAHAAMDNGDMTQTLKGLDVLGRQPWKINKPVFDTMVEVWNSGEGIANIPPENPQFTMPPEPSVTADPSERRAWLGQLRKIENERGGLHSQRCFQNFQLEIARALKDHTFYFPHNVDFRGRAYPIPPYLNHMGADHCRGLLMFGNGKKLGPGGLRWLKIHLANLYGFDKASLTERETFADKNMDEIRDSAVNRLHGRRWWLKAEDPWQCLACCIELINAIDSGNPEAFVSHLPVHQDGTCNGLQHYAALGGDEWGARQVNLEPGDRPADVYSAVANLVKEAIVEDRAKGNEYAEILDGKITRKVVKQTVMTNVYGVTLMGARQQVLRQLTALYPDLPSGRFINPNTLANYITKKIFTALANMFKGAHDIQYWLGECAGRITQCITPDQVDRILEVLATRHENTVKTVGNVRVKMPRHEAMEVSSEELLRYQTSVIWTTPLRMPVVQPYRTQKSKVVKTHLQAVKLREPRRNDPVSKRKQLQAFPPNFIHSLDATHMLLSALECNSRGLSFAAVHDSFWTHAADVPTMNEVLRDAFVRIHSEDIIGRLASEFKTRYSDCIHQASIRADSPLGKRIAEWRKKEKASTLAHFGKVLEGPVASKMKMAELLLEQKRIRLLASSDPAEVAEGKAMVTPGSMFEEMSAEEDIEAPSDILALGLHDTSGSTGNATSMEDDAELEEPAEDSDVDANALGGLSESGQEYDDANVIDLGSGMGTGNALFAKAVGASSRSVRATKTVWAWVPWTLPPLPEKGSFEVSRTQKSDYFFS